MCSVLVRRLGVAAVVAFVLAVAASAASPLSVKFTDTTLNNGLRVIISEDHVAPVLSVAVLYNVGSRDKRTGRTGFAHLFEHMMFKGSANVGAGEHFYSVFSNGGTMNGTTNKERTLYARRVMRLDRVDNSGPLWCRSLDLPGPLGQQD
ncbi:MAG TPA: insulinase family protein [Vicinamibacterales bacterium]|nr:insulinase family protein [Vicinamibacterales bacterium]